MYMDAVREDRAVVEVTEEDTEQALTLAMCPLARMPF